MFSRTTEKEIENLEDLGETEVRYQLAQFSYSGSSQIAEEWLRQKEAVRKERIESESLAVTKAASLAAATAASAALEQARWARWAAFIAMVAALIAAKDQIRELINLLFK